VPENVQRVFFKEQNVSHDMQWSNVKDVSSFGKYISGSYGWGQSAAGGKPSP
jgi:hypothetical protein